MNIPLPILDEDTTSTLHLATSNLPCDAWHHYYHYQSSAQYLWLATTLYILGKNEEALHAYNKAIFQDHFNEEALEGRKAITNGTASNNAAPIYNKHPMLDIEFRKSIGMQAVKATALHDEANVHYLKAEYKLALSLLTEQEHSNSRLLAGKCYFALEEYENAAKEFAEAIRQSHIDHIAYHRTASDEHLQRGMHWLSKNETDIAIADFTKALDLHRPNKEALKARARTYKLKGNIKMAEADEFLLSDSSR